MRTSSAIMSAETSARRWSSSGQPFSRAQKRASTAVARDQQKISISVSHMANGMSRPQTAATKHERPAPGRPTSGRPTSGRPTSGRPTSGRVRPLSGRVFLQKTVMKGWVARSNTDLDEDVDLEDYDEDDDWDDGLSVGGSDTMLDGLLSSRRIMDSKKGQHVDWRAGDVAIPTFHCPRCRDHWYGLTSYPCEDELARLIREGLWYTGQGPVDRDLLFKKGHGLNGRERQKKDPSTISSDGLKLPPIVQRSESETSLSSSSRQVPGDRQGKNSKGKRITFNLDHEEFHYSQDEPTKHSTTNQDQSMKMKNGRQEDDSKGASGGNGEFSDTKQKHGVKLENSTSGQSGLSPNGNNSSGLGKTANSSGNSLLKSSVLGDLDQSNTRGGDQKIASPFSGGGSVGKSLSGADDGDHKSGMKTKVTSSDNTRPSHNGSNNIYDGNTNSLSDRNASANSGQVIKTTGGEPSNLLVGSNQRNGSKGDTNGTAVDHGDKNRRVDSDCDSDDERGKRDARHEDRGKHVRVPGAGFIARASSPTGSEWGDPTHALSYLSNTTSSSRVGSSLGGRIQDNGELGKTHSDPQLLKTSKKPQLTADDFIFGPMFTRAFTFSYYNSGRAESQGSKESLTKSTKKGKRKK